MFIFQLLEFENWEIQVNTRKPIGVYVMKESLLHVIWFRRQCLWHQRGQSDRMCLGRKRAEGFISEFLSPTSWVATLERPTLAAEVLALHPPVVIAIVKPDEAETAVHHIIFIWTVYFRLSAEEEKRKAVGLNDAIWKNAISQSRRPRLIKYAIFSWRLGLTYFIPFFIITFTVIS